MNKRLEEKLARLAFEDMGSEEMGRLEQEVVGDREAMRILAEYRNMRLGLKAMGNIPEHQLSTERLRHAVLNRGLKTKPAPQLGWLWMPVAAMALTCGVVMLRNSHHSVLPGSDGPVAFGTTEKRITDRPGEEFALATASSEIISVARPEPPIVPVSHVRINRQLRERNDRIAALKEAVRLGFDNEVSAENTGHLSLPSGSSAPAQTASAPIVLIGNAKDPNTGAQKATEVDSASNVVVGG